jgi:transaldolase/glucose-6-phosphate isomerase
MKDAGIEARRQIPAPERVLRASLGQYEEAVQSALREAEQADIIRRIWDKDALVWKSEPAHQKIIRNSLGWLTVATEMLGATQELEQFAATIRAEGYRHVMVCGMGGSSLCPEVLRKTFGERDGFPTLLVLDSTDPDVVNNFSNQIDLSRCLFAVASKSGTTTEPVAFHRYWFNEVSRVSDSPGDSFIAVTDPETQMAAAATAEGFKHTFLNQPDIGGRYSALSYFGMVPAALMGVDVSRLLHRAEAMAQLCRAPVEGNPAALLGAVMAECALAGRDKLTIVADERLSTLGLWIEQLVAESTGKEGKGIVPVVGEPLGDVSTYGDDRFFLAISLGVGDNNANSKLKALEDAGHPVVYRSLDDIYDLGAEFFLWEMATVFAAWRLAINPFDQPNVQEAKDATKALLEKYAKAGKLGEQQPVAQDAGLTVYGAVESDGSTLLAEVVGKHFAKAQRGDYIALLVYLEETPEIEAALKNLRTTLRDITGCAVTSGYGPRYLHSTGQLHKGGPDSGLFLEITAADKTDCDVPQTAYSFSVLKQAQAQGDLEALLAHHRRAIRVDLGNDILGGLRRLRELMHNRAL